MSLRQLKFKPKLQPNSAVKNKTDESNIRPINKQDALSSTPPVINSDSNIGKNVNTVETSLDKAKSIINERKEDISKQNVTSHQKHGGNDTSNGAQINDYNISENKNVSGKNVLPISPSDSLTSLETTSEEPTTSNHIVDQIRNFIPCPEKSVTDGALDLPCSDSNEHVKPLESPKRKRNSNNLINYDVMKKVNFQDSQQIYSFSSDRQNKIDRKSLSNSFPVNGMQELSEFSDLKEMVVPEILDNRHVNENKTSHPSAVVTPFRCESSLETKSSSTNTASNSDLKQVKKKKVEGKKLTVGSSKPNTHQRVNFKPNLITLGRIKRPEKFATSSYSKMESAAKEQFFKKFGNNEEPDSSRLTMMDLIFYNPSSNPMSQSSDKKVLTSLETSNAEKVEGNISKESTVSDECDKSSDEGKNENDVLPVPQLKISADGKVVVAQESLVIQPSQNLSNTSFESVIDEEFRKRKPVKNPNRCGWSHNDTIKFYKALNSLGCDFETMQSIFPDRSRKNLKSKFKKEEKLHGSLINKILCRHSEFDLANVVRELEIDSVYNETLKTYGRGLVGKKSRRGRKKPISSIVAGKSRRKDEYETDDDFISDEEVFKQKRKAELEVISKISNVLGLNDSDNSTDPESKNTPEKVANSIVLSVKEGGRKKRKIRKSKENLGSDTDVDSKFTEPNNSGKTSGVPKQQRKQNSPSKILPSNSIVIRLEDLINFNEGVDNETQPDQVKSEVVKENHIVINTNIEFENVKYTRYISYNSNNLENPIEINETVAHVD